MKTNNSFKWLIIGICVLVAISVTLTFFILNKWTTPASKTNESIDTNSSDCVFHSAYLYSFETDEICFLSESEFYSYKRVNNLEIDGEIGVYDIKIEDNKVVSLTKKNETKEGVLLSYSADTIEVEGHGKLKRNDFVPVYSLLSNKPVMISWSDLVIGSSNLTYVMDNDAVCAVLMKQNSPITKINVLIKNQDSVFYSDLYIGSEGNLIINGQDCGAMICHPIDFLSNDCDSVTIQAQNNQLYLCDENGKRLSNHYEGSFIVKGFEEGLTLVNNIGMEEYLRYVLPSEMPVSFSYEALKAQAICARTYAYSKMNNNSYAMYGANIDDSTSYQVYNVNETSEITDQAVLDTDGLVIKKDGEYITCFYYSTSPGITEDMEVWQEETPEYIKKQSTLIRSDAGEQNIEALQLTKEEVFSEFIHEAPASYDSASLFYRWNATLDFSNVSDAEYGKLIDVSVIKRSDSGYVTELSVNYEKGSRVLYDENEIRKFMGQGLTLLTLYDGSTREGLQMIPSACFCIDSQAEQKLEIRGGGFGHGIGLSQYAASALGNAGMNCEAIIKFFYHEVTLEKIN